MKRKLGTHRTLLLVAGLWLGGGVHSIQAADQHLAQPPVIMVVSRDNPTRALSRQEVQDIFLGRSTQFPDGRRAVPVDQSPDSAVRQAFNSDLLERSPAQIRSHWAKIIFTGRGRPPVDVADDDAVKAAITSNAHAIGYIRPDQVDDRVSVVVLQ